MALQRLLSLVLVAALAGCATGPAPRDAGGAPAVAVDEAEVIERGMASWYGDRHHGRRTANGEAFDMNALTAAHRTLPFGTRVRVLNPGNGASVVVRINDRGPYAQGRIIDLSRAAAERLGLLREGVGAVVLLAVDDARP
ncbi:MAG: septal ring lytic transglycosylase RlpA family protein [Hydrogenophaga sp.]|uniref:Endolytic peptidoglycan transglycosylase RlpA n=1 Tax=Hydrogenophaga crocea TaxID=2716225 RepID=A0A6G8IM99_9BURK|nr:MULTISPECIES: septal ring lytic transglycosylase RlpA family protein [Hydrogenophaga]MBL0944793.1 septal ring lytic transglycosylase RlpA family protein [Hydrogenophaga sp.]QIM54156.1 septal ring lytic transglycosylase RlpA family protein [Hydrogenophaga crocea]